MKKKTIEKIPYLGLPKLVKNKMVRYAAVAAMEEIGQVEHLIIEVYRNKKEYMKVPVVRIVITAKDFATYLPESKTWSREKICGTDDELIWRKDDERPRQPAGVEDIIYSAEDLKRIQGFTKDIAIWSKPVWWKYVERKQDDIVSSERNERSRRKYERRRQALEDRQAHTQELPKKRILNYADSVLFHEEHHLFYKKHGSWAKVACSKCGGVTDARWRLGESYESQFERIIEEPRTNYYGTCPMCGASGKYIAQGREKSYNKNSGYLFLGQRYKEDGMVFRYIVAEKEWNIGMLCVGNGMEMYNSSEKVLAIEIARVYFEPGKKIQRDYHKHDPYSGEDFWDDCNLCGMMNINIREGRIMPETFENMKGTFLQYSALKEYQDAKGRVNPADYLERYIQSPQIELLVKMGLIKVVNELVKCHYGIVKDENANRVDEFLGIRKERIRQLIRSQGDIKILEVMQTEKRLDKKWTDKQIEQIKELDLGYQVRTAIAYMGIQQFLNRVSRYAGCEYGTMCSASESRLKQTALFYIDYLSMRKDMGYDMQNTIYLFPKNLADAHMKMVMEHNKAEADKRIRQVNERFPLIKKKYRSLRKKFYYEDEEFMIRPARDAGEIVMEGRVLHHCVGGDNYLKKHNDGKSTILFLRNKTDPEIPYITVEVTEALDIMQWYGVRDTKPDEKRIQKWLKQYTARLRCGGMEAGLEEQEGIRQRTLAYA